MPLAYEMKDSGVPWIGKLPSNWETLRLKYASWLKGRIGWQGLKSNEYTDDGAYLITGTDFDNGIINWKSCAHITVERFNEDEDIHIIEDDLLITKDGTIGKVAIAKNCPEMVSLNSGVMLIRNIRKFKYYDKYLYYVLLSDQFHHWYELSQNGASTIRHLYQEQFYNFTFSYPPLPEQEAIASYLDRKCELIDDIIAQAKSTIEEYKAWKASVIFEAVTKGLDRNAEMKDSGVEWIGEIPRGWILSSIKHHFNITLGKMLESEQCNQESSYENYLCASNVKWAGVDLNTQRQMWFSQKEKDEYLLKEGDLLVMEGGATAGTTCIYHGEFAPCYMQNSINRCRPKNGNTTCFLYYWMFVIYHSGHIESICNQATFKHLTKEKLGCMPFLVPPLPEQEAIVSYLDKKCGEIDAVIEEKQALIVELEAYKKSLIYEAVTGKRKVI